MSVLIFDGVAAKTTNNIFDCEKINLGWMIGQIL